MRVVVRRGGVAAPAASTSNTWWWIAGLSAMAACVAISNWPLLHQLGSALPGNLGDPLLNVWILAWVSQAILGSDLWHPPIFYPYDGALALSEPLLGLIPISSPLFFLTGDAITAYNATFLILPFLTFFGAAALVRELTGRLDAGIIVGVLVATSPYLAVSQITRIQVLTCGWSFLALAGLHRLLKTRSVAAAAVFTGSYILQALSNTYLGIYLAIPVGIVILHAMLVSKEARNRQTLLKLGASIAIVALALAPVAWVLADAKSQFGVSRTDAETAAYSADVGSYFSVWYEQNPRWLIAEKTADRALFHGWGLLLLSAAGLCAVRRHGWWAHPVCVYALVAMVTFALSLGPAPTAWGSPLGIPSPYILLADLLPGFDALRSPGRFAVFVLLAMAVAAGFSMSAWLSKVPLAVRAATLLVCAAVGASQSARAFDWVARIPEPASGSREAYGWLALQPPGAMIELPVVASYQKVPRTAGESVTLFYQLAALEHGHRLVNGSSGFTPPFTEFMQGSASPLATMNQPEVGIRLLRSIGVRYLVMHADQYTEEASAHAASLGAWLRSATDHVQEYRSFDQTSLFVLRAGDGEIQTPAVGAVTRVDADLMRVEGSSNRSLVYRLTDGDLRQRWTAPQRVGTRVRISLEDQRPIAGVTLHLRPHSTADYPRHLRVVGVRSDGSSVGLFNGYGALELGRQLVRAPQEPSVPLWWLPRTLVSVDIEIASDIRAWQWSVHEIDVWEATPAAARTRLETPSVSEAVCGPVDRGSC